MFGASTMIRRLGDEVMKYSPVLYEAKVGKLSVSWRETGLPKASRILASHSNFLPALLLSLVCSDSLLLL